MNKLLALTITVSFPKLTSDYRFEAGYGRKHVGDLKVKTTDGTLLCSMTMSGSEDYFDNSVRKAFVENVAGTVELAKCGDHQVRAAVCDDDSSFATIVMLPAGTSPSDISCEIDPGRNWDGFIPGMLIEKHVFEVPNVVPSNASTVKGVEIGVTLGAEHFSEEAQ